MLLKARKKMLNVFKSQFEKIALLHKSFTIVNFKRLKQYAEVKAGSLLLHYIKEVKTGKDIDYTIAVSKSILQDIKKRSKDYATMRSIVNKDYNLVGVAHLDSEAVKKAKAKHVRYDFTMTAIANAIGKPEFRVINARKKLTMLKTKAKAKNTKKAIVKKA